MSQGLHSTCREATCSFKLCCSIENFSQWSQGLGSTYMNMLCNSIYYSHCSQWCHSTLDIQIFCMVVQNIMVRGFYQIISSHFCKNAYFAVMSVLDLVLSHNVRSCILKISLCRIDWTKLCLRIQVSPECRNITV